ncbi:MAG: diguanylate cyclase [Gammaproteobacteria bacterium]|uniref:sensor domain-containing diguanylate cyclase n=1 Tax=Rhodoferax sp. TaxID=50421 RepID=UPI001D7B9A77|nr:diguanylate cyclase [Rhodoferax sp.]MBU3898860.1 diguanylate cyclase [Gammaproteobacteria bacterium]MBU3999051.1 diguanylate cyclase [Gammaproteobacteria bacterium]MBU4019336.1 diguanylate cyclase [Gammaproteobacteria bacterium]MBU4081900.1 diguanylate cyclase [Gammaproteobacteria bacterium]MBU4112014.1 diguanylate cyclase [Gammaproteobacteria bacterium]
MAFRRNPLSLDELRELARKRFLGRSASSASALSVAEAQHLFEELEIHQIELELQNEHLNTARLQLESALNQSNQFNDFAPVGIFSLDGAGTITKLNLAGASLLGRERARLLGSRLALFVADADRPNFNAMLEQATGSGDVQSGELTFANKGPLVSHVQIKVAALAPSLGWQIILLDVTERRLAQEQLRASEERWKLALEAAGDGVWDWNVLTGETAYSRRFGQLYGFAENEYGHHLDDWITRIHPKDKSRVINAHQDCLSGQHDSTSVEFRGQCKDGNYKWVLSRGSVVSRSAEGKALRMVGTQVDISARKQTEEALLVASRFQQAVFDSLVAQVAVLDHRATVLQTNAAWRQYAHACGFSERPCCLSSSYLSILACLTEQDPQTLQAAQLGISAVLAGELPQFHLPEPFFTPLDNRWFSLKITPVHDQAQRLVVSHEDVTALKTAELASLTLANVDTLTGALSRRNFFNLAEQEVARSIRYDLPLMVLMLDLDHFKTINDQHGHAAGDVVLQKCVQTVTSVLRESDLIGRIGGEEFAVLLPNTPLEGGRALAQRIVESVRANPVQAGGKPIVYTVSIGAGCLSGEHAFDELLGLADAALYRAKDAGRDRLELSTELPPALG